jgi:hypothetical protein
MQELRADPRDSCEQQAGALHCNERCFGWQLQIMSIESNSKLVAKVARLRALPYEDPNSGEFGYRQ